MAKGTNLLFKAAALLIVQSFKLLQLQLDTIQKIQFKLLRCVKICSYVPFKNKLASKVALVISLHEFVDICEPYIDAIIIIAFNK